MRLTEHGQRVAEAIVADEYLGIAGADDGWEFFCPWAEEFAEITAGVCGVPPTSVGGIVAGLSEAGFLTISGAGRDASVSLTPEGRTYCGALAAQ